MSLLQELADYNNKPILGNQSDWFLFIYDHIADIRAKAKEVTVTAALMNQVEHSIPQLMRNQNVPSEYTWIVYLINDFASDLGFTRSRTGDRIVYMPDTTYITDLYNKYNSSSQVTNAARAS